MQREVAEWVDDLVAQRVGDAERAAVEVGPRGRGGDVPCVAHGAADSVEEVAALPDDESHRQEIRNILKLRKENAKLRALAVELSNLLGDLPVREWEDAVAAHAYGPPTSR